MLFPPLGTGTSLLLDVNYIRNEQTDRADHSENNAGQHEPERDAIGLSRGSGYEQSQRGRSLGEADQKPKYPPRHFKRNNGLEKGAPTPMAIVSSKPIKKTKITASQKLF
jgi:hypothetical protein